MDSAAAPVRVALPPAPAAQQRLGLLEKHKDYKLRAQDYHKKQAALHTLKEKASFKNQDEFYFNMISSKTQGGVHIKRQDDHPDADKMRAFKREDATYVASKAVSEAKARARWRCGWGAVHVR